MFSDSITFLNLEQRLHSLTSRSRSDVRATLNKPSLGMSDFDTLISPAAGYFLEELAQRAHALTVQRFGKTIQLFVPLYISNLCYNKCTYCGFSVDKKYPRKILTDAEILNEGRILSDKGFQHLLILTGEAEDKVGIAYIKNAVDLLRPLFSSISVEIQPLSYDDYLILRESGVDGLTMFQETYHRDTYSKYHVAGKKKHYANRLDALEAGAEAGFNKISLGALLGLFDWRYEAIALAEHINYLQTRYWQSTYTISFPRIKDMGSEFEIQFPVNDKELVQYICAFRLCFTDLGITLSTRESPHFRNNILKLGITHMSAESNTAPGGYSGGNQMPQFETSDHRSLTEIMTMVNGQGYAPVLKDWLRI